MTDSCRARTNTLDAYAPQEIARRVATIGSAKASLSTVETAVLGLLGGTFIAFGAMFYTLVMAGADAGYGPNRLLGGIAFSLGLVLVVVGGAELFTGNNLIVMAWAERRVTTARLLRNWGLVYVANLVGAIATAVAVHLSGAFDIAGVGSITRDLAEAKVALPPAEAFFRGILCNALVCLAIWLSVAARDVSGKVLAIVFPIAAFVGLGFEHSVANMYLIPAGMLAGATNIRITDFLLNLLPVTAGNIVGGSGGVALTYWAVYLRGRPLPGVPEDGLLVDPGAALGLPFDERGQDAEKAAPVH